MIFLYILLAVAVLIGAVMLIPIRVYVSFDNDIKLSLKILFRRICILPRKEKNVAEKADRGEAKKQKIIGKGGVFDSLSQLFCIIKMLFGKVVWVLSKIKIHKLDARIVVAKPDAADTGIEYGAVCSLIYPALGFLGSRTDISKANVNVVADFDSGEGSITAETEISLRTFYAVCAAISALWQYIKIKSANNTLVNNTERKK